MRTVNPTGRSAVASKGWIKSYKWLLLRRLSQLSILFVFLLGPWAGVWLIKGNLTSSVILNTLPLSDPYILLQSLFAGHVPHSTALIGAAIVLVFYLLIGGRMYCSWVCPINILTDFAAWLRLKLRIKSGMRLSNKLRYWLLGMTLLLAAGFGSLVWELVNPVSIVHRGLIFGVGLVWFVLFAIFLLDVLISSRAWCGHLCPVGAFYSLLAKFSLLRVSATRREQCDDCMDCFHVCPEKQVIKPALKGDPRTSSPVIYAENCTNCGRCIDVCAKEVFNFSSRFYSPFSKNSNVTPHEEVTP